jgi:hypothetical protein
MTEYLWQRALVGETRRDATSDEWTSDVIRVTRRDRFRLAIRRVE